MDEDQVIQRGVVASRLLNDTEYTAFFEETKGLLLQCILNTNPEDTAKRECLYHQLNGLSEVLGTMHSYVDATEAILEKRKQSTDEQSSYPDGR